MEGRTAAHSTATRSTTARSTAVGWTGVWWAAAWVVAVASAVLLWATHPTPSQRIRAVSTVEVPGPISFGDEPASTDHATR